MADASKCQVLMTRGVEIFLRPLLPKLQEVNMKRLAQDSGLQNNRQFCADLELA